MKSLPHSNFSKISTASFHSQYCNPQLIRGLSTGHIHNLSRYWATVVGTVFSGHLKKTIASFWSLLRHQKLKLTVCIAEWWWAIGVSTWPPKAWFLAGASPYRWNATMITVIRMDNAISKIQVKISNDFSKPLRSYHHDFSLPTSKESMIAPNRQGKTLSRNRIAGQIPIVQIAEGVTLSTWRLVTCIAHKACWAISSDALSVTCLDVWTVYFGKYVSRLSCTSFCANTEIESGIR